MAIPLTKYLDRGGSYEGFDIVPDGIRWCKEKISPRFPNFHFQLVDLHNKGYNPRGKYSASDFRSPYESDSFDFVFLTSVFTHMLPKDLENYLGEIARILKRGGRCLSTFFLLNRGSSELINAGKSTLPFKYECGDYRTIDLDTPESAVCYEELFILSLYERNGLTIKHPIRYGSWCKRSKPLSYQDIVIASK
jgi:SAM-dependent methyltransferase